MHQARHNRDQTRWALQGPDYGRCTAWEVHGSQTAPRPICTFSSGNRQKQPLAVRAEMHKACVAHKWAAEQQRPDPLGQARCGDWQQLCILMLRSVHITKIWCRHRDRQTTSKPQTPWTCANPNFQNPRSRPGAKVAPANPQKSFALCMQYTCACSSHSGTSLGSTAPWRQRSCLRNPSRRAEHIVYSWRKEPQL